MTAISVTHMQCARGIKDCRRTTIATLSCEKNETGNKSETPECREVRLRDARQRQLGECSTARET